MANETKVTPFCLNLRCKEMFYKDITAPPTEHDLVVEKLYGKTDNRVYWCQCTQTGRGPDERPVDMEACRRKDRKCYKGLEDLA